MLVVVVVVVVVLVVVVVVVDVVVVDVVAVVVVAVVVVPMQLQGFASWQGIGSQVTQPKGKHLTVQVCVQSFPWQGSLQ